MKTPSRKLILIYTAIAMGAGLLMGIVRTVVSNLYLDTGIELYAPSSIPPIVMHVLLVLCAVIVATSGMFPLHKNHAAASMETPSQFTLFSSMLTGFMLLAYDFFLVYDISSDNWAALRPLFGHAPTGSVTLASAAFTMLLLLFAIPAALFFFRAAQRCQKPSQSVLCTLTVIWFVLFALRFYFDSAVAFNSPTKILRILAILCMAFYAIHENRRILGIAMPRIYFPAAYLAMFVCTVHLLSDICLLANKKIVAQDGYLGLAVELAYLIYILSRVLYLGTTKSTPAPKAEDSAQAEVPAADQIP